MKRDFDGVESGVAAAAAAEGTAGAGGKRRVGTGREPGERRWKRWLEEARARGISEMELVVELHLCRGLPLPEVAEVLELKLNVVRWLWLQARGGPVRGMSAPKSKEDFALLREQVGSMLWQTVADTCLDPEPAASGGAMAAKRAAPMMGVRLRALRQIADLYGVNPKAKKKTKEVEPNYRQVEPATPEEISELVRKWLEERGKGGVAVFARGSGRVHLRTGCQHRRTG
ncbi:hypothetical protein [Prosthecobacter sp.]|uniref:hypothetical protein n=1 Tax=Prosthecobacter sp. TaxID=1965333 RepID=UPI003784F4E2